MIFQCLAEVTMQLHSEWNHPSPMAYLSLTEVATGLHNEQDYISGCLIVWRCFGGVGYSSLKTK